MAEVDPSACRQRGTLGDGSGGSPLLGSASSSSDDEDWEDGEEWEEEDSDAEGDDGGSGEEAGEEGGEVDYPGSSAEEELQGEEEADCMDEQG